jgi:hypothetical protein
MLGVFAELETNLRRERQLEGIAKAKAARIYKGRPPPRLSPCEYRHPCGRQARVGIKVFIGHLPVPPGAVGAISGAISDSRGIGNVVGGTPVGAGNGGAAHGRTRYIGGAHGGC